MVDGVAHTPLVDQHRAKTGLLHFNGTGQAGGTGANDKEIEEDAVGGRGGRQASVLALFQAFVAHGFRLGHLGGSGQGVGLMVEW